MAPDRRAVPEAPGQGLVSGREQVQVQQAALVQAQAQQTALVQVPGLAQQTALEPGQVPSTDQLQIPMVGEQRWSRRTRSRHHSLATT